MFKKVLGGGLIPDPLKTSMALGPLVGKAGGEGGPRLIETKTDPTP